MDKTRDIGVGVPSSFVDKLITNVVEIPPDKRSTNRERNNMNKYYMHLKIAQLKSLLSPEMISVQLRTKKKKEENQQQYRFLKTVLKYRKFPLSIIHQRVPAIRTRLLSLLYVLPAVLVILVVMNAYRLGL